MSARSDMPNAPSILMNPDEEEKHNNDNDNEDNDNNTEFTRKDDEMDDRETVMGFHNSIRA